MEEVCISISEEVPVGSRFQCPKFFFHMEDLLELTRKFSFKN